MVHKLVAEGTKSNSRYFLIQMQNWDKTLHTSSQHKLEFLNVLCPAGQFYVFMTTLLAKTVTKGFGFGHYTPPMIASEAVLRFSSKKCKIKLIP